MTAYQHRFTLVELLVVISIVAMLAALMLPALNRARDMSKNASCVSNQKQIGIAARLYWGDWDRHLPGGPVKSMPGDHVREKLEIEELWTSDDAEEDDTPPVSCVVVQ